jgi:spore maturation protein CgeB
MGSALIVGTFASWPGALETSIERATADIGWRVSRFDLHAEVQRHARFGHLGRRLNEFLAVEEWAVKGNRELVRTALRSQPDVLIVVGQAPIHPGALAQLRASTSTRLVLLWPDTLINLHRTHLDCLPLFHLVASYSHAAVPVFTRLGCERVEWVPLGADPVMHQPHRLTGRELAEYSCDISFVGNWRPERERLLTALSDLNVTIKVWGGPAWKACEQRVPALKGTWQGRPIYEQEFAKAVSASRISVNRIDETNYPAANMRFFEVPAAGGLQLASACPEMANAMIDQQHVVYFKDEDDARRLAAWLLKDEDRRAGIASMGHREVLKHHTYAHRMTRLLATVYEGTAA